MADSQLWFWASHQEVLVQVVYLNAQLFHKLIVEPCSLNDHLA